MTTLNQARLAKSQRARDGAELGHAIASLLDSLSPEQWMELVNQAHQDAANPTLYPPKPMLAKGVGGGGS